MKPIYVCDCCSLCCQRLLVEANALDVLREPQIQALRPLPCRPVSLPVLDACWILGGPGMPCPFLNRESRCRIYRSRPGVCVTFMAGSPKCQELRREHGLAALVAHPGSDEMLAEIQQALLDEFVTDASESSGTHVSVA